METTPEQIEAHVSAAHEAYEAARDVPPAVRARWLTAVADRLDAHAAELVALAVEETHLTQPRLTGELTRTTFQARLLAAEVVAGEHLDATIDHADTSWGMGPRPDLRRVNVPLGVVAVFGASNFPFAFSVFGGDTVSALAAGCSVVHKVHSAHPRLGARTAELVVSALEDAGAPAGLFSSVHGRPAGPALIDHPLTRAGAFTGSEHAGRLLFDRANARPVPIPFYGELGSINPVFVTRAAWQARGDEIVRGYVASYTLGVGQFCTKPGVLVVPAPVDERLATLEAAARDVAPAAMLTPRLASSFRIARDALVQRGGVDLLIRGDASDTPAPTLMAISADRARADRSVLAEEVFGPASLLVGYDDEAELPGLAALFEGQLTATLHAEPADDVAALVRAIADRAGRVLWNGWPTGVSVTYAQQHGGPYPATTAPSTTSVGTAAIRRFTRPVAYQAFPDHQLPPPLREANPWGVRRRVDGAWHEPDRAR
ncbi:MAG: aldehyde dehydrogenase (NADP(+)) [Actinomycetales bacterium]|nr:aldehyde dehydrogenase (NADP(+)) [Actinomycetales bacterium]